MNGGSRYVRYVDESTSKIVTDPNTSFKSTVYYDKPKYVSNVRRISSKEPIVRRIEASEPIVRRISPI